VTSDGRRSGPSGQPDPVDPLALAEAVAAGRLGFAAAEAALWEAHPDDQGRAANEVAELRDLVTAIRGVRRHAEAVRRAGVEVFDPDATSVPLGSARPLDDDLGIAPRRVQGGDVRLRPAARQRQRWAPVGALAAVAVLVVAVAILAPSLLAPSIAATPVPSASPSGLAIASPSASLSAPPAASSTAASATSGPSVPPSPISTGVAGAPPIPSEPLAGAPGIAYWTRTAANKVTVTEWRPGGGAARFRFSMSTEVDPCDDVKAISADCLGLPTNASVDRRIVVSPDGTRVVFAETSGSFARTRVFGTDGTLLWTDPKPVLTPDLAWSADGTRLVVGAVPDAFTLVTFAGGAGSGKVVRFPGAAYRFLGFSDSGGILYGWDTNGEAEWWQTPFQVPVKGGTVAPITTFGSGKTEPIAVSNGTTPTTNIAPENGTSTQVAGVDPLTFRVLDTGSLSGQGDTWEVRDGNGSSGGTSLKGLTTDKALAWGPNGSIVVAELGDPKAPATITTVSDKAPGTPLTPTFAVAAGTYWRLFEGSRSGFALLGLGAKRAQDPSWFGADELVAVDLATGASAVLIPDDAGLTGLHTAGWITAP
jgi:hypothetical protein